jgi:hypothetical protein
MFISINNPVLLMPVHTGNLLKPQLARGELRCIGATTLDEYRKYIEKDPALERRFQQVRRCGCAVLWCCLRMHVVCCGVLWCAVVWCGVVWCAVLSGCVVSFGCIVVAVLFGLPADECVDRHVS